MAARDDQYNLTKWIFAVSLSGEEHSIKKLNYKNIEGKTMKPFKFALSILIMFAGSNAQVDNADESFEQYLCLKLTPLENAANDNAVGRALASFLGKQHHLESYRAIFDNDDCSE